MNISIDKELHRVVSEWITFLQKQKGYSSHTLKAYMTDLFYFFAFLNGYRGKQCSISVLDSLSLQDFRAWLAARKIQKSSDASNTRHLSSVKSFYKYMSDKGLSDNTAIYNLKMRGSFSGKSLPKVVSLDDALSALEKAAEVNKEEWQQYRDKTIIMLVYGSGLRISEALSLQYKDFLNALDYGIKVRGKGSKERVVPVLPQTIEYLEKYRSLCGKDTESGALFFGKRGQPLSADIFRKQLQKIRQLAGLPSHTTPHAFRHSFATHLLDRGCSIRAIQELLGHSNLNTTQKYTQVTTQNMINNYCKHHPRAKM